MYFLILLANHLHFALCFVELNGDMKSFAFAKKQVRCEADKEILLYEHNVGPGVVTEQWYTGAGCFDQNTIIRYYIDGEMTASIEANLFALHGIIFYDSAMPAWGTKWIGHLAQNGGLYNTFRIPFQKSIRITFEPKSNGYWWYIIRGVENFPVIIGDMELPTNARLRLHKLANIFNPLSYLHLANSTSDGLIFMVTLGGQSSDFHYLEGCFRLIVGNNSKIQYLSSGTEDFFLSAYYYNKGIYHTDHAGLTYIKTPGTMSAYKFFVSDPLLFKGSFDLLWRVGEVDDNNCFNGSPEKCYVENGMTYCKPGENEYYDANLKLAKTNITSYVLTYEW